MTRVDPRAGPVAMVAYDPAYVSLLHPRGEVLRSAGVMSLLDNAHESRVARWSVRVYICRHGTGRRRVGQVNVRVPRSEPAHQSALGHEENMRIEPASTNPPPGLHELLADLDGGENGFGGTPVHTGEATVDQYLQRCCDMPDPGKLCPGLVPQTVYWMLNSNGLVVGMVRVRHYLNDKLRVHGGHIGFFVRRDQRGKGYAKEALRLALIELRKLGEKRALLTVDPENTPSITVIEMNGGHVEDIGTDPDTGQQFRRYWIELEPQQPSAA